jgi:osmotically-inducible protein OsmY
VRFSDGDVRGLVAVLQRAFKRPNVSVDDETVKQRIRSDALRDVGVPSRDIEIDVENRVATIHGSVQSRSHADGLLARVQKVPGVRAVAAMLRVSGAQT